MGSDKDISITDDTQRVGGSTRAISPTFSLLNEFKNKISKITFYRVSTYNVSSHSTPPYSRAGILPPVLFGGVADWCVVVWSLVGVAAETLVVFLRKGDGGSLFPPSALFCSNEGAEPRLHTTTHQRVALMAGSKGEAVLSYYVA